MSCKTPIQPAGIIGGNLGALATVEGLTPIVLTLASHTVGNRLGKTRKSRGGNMGTVALPALLVVANDQVYKMLGKSKTVKGGRRGRGRRGRHIYTKKVRGGETRVEIGEGWSKRNERNTSLDFYIENIFNNVHKSNKLKKFVVKSDSDKMYNDIELQHNGVNKSITDIKNEIQSLIPGNVYWVPKDTNPTI